MIPVARLSPVPWRTRGRRLPVVTGGVAVLLAASTGCGILTGGANGETTDDITVTSPMIREGETIPARYTCDGDGVSPPLRWSGLPSGTESIAVVVDDPEADAGATVYWVVYGLDPENPELPEGGVPQPGRQGVNSSGATGYEPPCPSDGDEHEFRFTVYALGSEIDLPESAPLDEALGAIASNTLARGRLSATGG
ncbi:YbhB/YbcL family Raf kinase inhibitor-like protein [Marinactinospora thermotolerans]|uniref:Phospholipid-binding protein, PBP family n=1 Tax=Marinactinospora thermotolerans DSM 45154 TaxID=1122192 RepID=A0A1T4S5B1_9ACTN|nr:YbhB/YbcL family Raf kinase inhibitor-like protein [Marinactinospora thermotolerans]SKA23392.1 hypothetical protein SAMN02745673_03212 [Marinactinospora thermotolerans DSM 45154]